MPLEAAELLLDAVSLGKPVWFLCGAAIDGLLNLAHSVASAKGAVALLPSMPTWCFVAMVAGGLWLCLWTTRARLAGILPIAVGAIGVTLSPSPDVLITGDGRHLAVISDGKPLILRDRAGDYVRSLLAEASGFDGDPEALDGQPGSDCSHDACVTVLRRNKVQWSLLATRSGTQIDWERIVGACASADIAVADRWLPRACNPRWLKLDRDALRQTGGIAIYLNGNPTIDTVAQRIGAHPWAETPQ